MTTPANTRYLNDFIQRNDTLMLYYHCKLRVGKGGIFPPKSLIGRIIPVVTRKVNLEGAILWLNGEYAHLLQMCLFSTVVLVRSVY